MIQKAIVLASLASYVAAHGAITQIMGLNGVKGTALGIDDSTPRSGAGARPFQQDTSVIRNSDIASGSTSACGKTKLGGAFDMVEMTDKIMSANGGMLPSIRAGETVTMNLHQINQDGAGPYNCDISSDGGEFMMMDVTTNVPGIAGLSAAQVKDLPLTVRVPAGMKSCTGGSNGATCIIRCRNTAIAGPFGGCVPVMMEAAAAAAPTAPTNASTADPAAMTKRSNIKGLVFARTIEFADQADEIEMFRRSMPSADDDEDN